jgi:hypothetical protein
MEAVAEATAEERRQQRCEAAEEAYKDVEYWERLTAEQRQAIVTSPVMRLCARRLWLEQERPIGCTVDGVDVGMEANERAHIDLAETKHVLAIALAVESLYDIDHAYATDGSADEAEARTDGEVGARAVAWGSWDGSVARGGALPPGVGNQVAELYAIERTLAAHGPGDRVLMLCDCQAAMVAVEAAWGTGWVGPHGPMAGTTAGWLVECIIRHRLRISDANTEGRRGLVCMVWVKAHGGGVAPNAYADAIAKSHLAEPVDAAAVDAPLLQLPRVCLYATTPPPAAHPAWEPAAMQRTCVAADRSLRRLIVEGLTRRVLAEWSEQMTQEGRAVSAATPGHERRVLAATAQVHARPVGAERGAAAQQGRTLPSATGAALRLRADDMQMGEGVDRRCVLCGTRNVDGGHVLQCAGTETE